MFAHLTRTPEAPTRHPLDPAALERSYCAASRNAHPTLQSADEVLAELHRSPPRGRRFHRADVRGSGRARFPLTRRFAQAPPSDSIRASSATPSVPRQSRPIDRWFSPSWYGLDQRQCEPYLRELPHRAVAPTLFGFELDAARIRCRSRSPDDLRELLRATLAEGSHARVSSSDSPPGDVALRMSPSPPPTPGRASTAALARLQPFAETCFATRIFERLGDVAEELLRDSTASARRLRTSMNGSTPTLPGGPHSQVRGDVRGCDSSHATSSSRSQATPASLRVPVRRLVRAAFRRVRRVRCVSETTLRATARSRDPVSRSSTRTSSPALPAQRIVTERRCALRLFARGPGTGT